MARDGNGRLPRLRDGRRLRGAGPSRQGDPPEWLDWLAAIAAPAYALRVGTLFTTEGVFAVNGVLGLWVPVIAAAGWIVVGSVVLVLALVRNKEERSR